MSLSRYQNVVPGPETGSMHEDRERCVRAVQSKDARFDGWFFTAVLTTGIYCRPSCPVVPPKPENMRFYPSAAAAQQAGFRACKRCRPDASPGSPEWDVRADLVARAMRLIADGVMDDGGVPGPRPPPRLQRPPGRAAAGGRARGGPAGAGPRAARPDCAAADRDDRAADGRRRVRGRVRQHPDLQRHRAGRVRAVPDAAARAGRARTGRASRPAACPCGCRSARRCSPTIYSVTWPPRRCPASRNGATAPTGAPFGCRTGTGSSPLRPAPDHVELPADPHRSARSGQRHQPVPPPAGSRRRPAGRGRPSQRRRRARAPGAQGAGPACPAHRRPARVRPPGRARPAGLYRRGPDPRGPPRRDARRARSTILAVP